MTDPTVLITGGAGYIGSHTVLACRARGRQVIVLDDLSRGCRSLVPKDVTFIEGDIGDSRLLDRVFREFRIAAVIHFAGHIVVPKSVTAPLEYYLNNTCKTLLLTQTCVDHKVDTFIFSSTAAVYGRSAELPVKEEAPTNPITPYGRSKLMSEWMLRDTAAAHSFRCVALRYFNVAGADPAGRVGQTALNATHLIKVASEAATGKRDGVAIFGEDYDTPDGTCIRDYIHVSDLADAHVGALDYLDAGKDSITLNCGYGRGYSVRDVPRAVERTAGVSLDVRTAPRRGGDAACMVADASKIRAHFQWAPQHDDLDEIVGTAVQWERRLGHAP